MLDRLRKLVRKRKIDFSSPEQTKRFQKSLSDLVSILFAVVFGVGLSQLAEFDGTLDLAWLIVAYSAVLLSWWGYHYGTIIGPREDNTILYAIDAFIIVIYWLIMNYRAPVPFVFLLYAIMFCLYFAWEVIRFLETRDARVREAMFVNLMFTLGMLIICAVAWWLHPIATSKVIWILPIGVFLYLAMYRYRINDAYTASAVLPEQDEQEQDADNRKMVDELLQHATNAKLKARAHLSNYRVGAAVLGGSGAIFIGCNVEFDNYSNTIHAEEAALAHAVTSGETSLRAIAVVTDGEGLAWPCGMCRQSLHELGGAELIVITSNGKKTETRLMRDLLPVPFSLAGEANHDA